MLLGIIEQSRREQRKVDVSMTGFCLFFVYSECKERERERERKIGQTIWRTERSVGLTSKRQIFFFTSWNDAAVDDSAIYL